MSFIERMFHHDAPKAQETTMHESAGVSANAGAGPGATTKAGVNTNATLNAQPAVNNSTIDKSPAMLDLESLAEKELASGKALLLSGVPVLAAFIATANGDVQGELPAFERDAVNIALDMVHEPERSFIAPFITGLAGGMAARENAVLDANLNTAVAAGILRLKAAANMYLGEPAPLPSSGISAAAAVAKNGPDEQPANSEHPAQAVPPPHA